MTEIASDIGMSKASLYLLLSRQGTSLRCRHRARDGFFHRENACALSRAARISKRQDPPMCEGATHRFSATHQPREIFDIQYRLTETGILFFARGFLQRENQDR